MNRRGFLGRLAALPFMGGIVQSLVSMPAETEIVYAATVAVPQYFDFEAIRVPLLYSELFPYIQATEIGGMQLAQICAGDYYVDEDEST